MNDEFSFSPFRSKMPIVVTKGITRTIPTSGWATYIDPKESIATMVFDVATLAAAPSSASLFVRWTWRVRYVALERESHPLHGSTTSRQPSFTSSFALSLSLRFPYYRPSSRFQSFVRTLAYALRKSANAPDADVGPPLIRPPRRPRSRFRGS